jgi:hypothetical protein
MMTMGKRIGKWSWALSADERMTAAIVDGARGDPARVSAKVRRAHDVMLDKQKKLLAMKAREGGTGSQHKVRLAI